MLRMCVTALVLALTTFSSSAQEAIKNCEWKEEGRVNVARVFMRQPLSYSFMVETGDKIFELINYSYVQGVRFHTDVPADKPLWVRILTCVQSGMMGSTYWFLEIHLHSPKEVEGAGWDAGKIGRGITQVIE